MVDMKPPCFRLHRLEQKIGSKQYTLHTDFLFENTKASKTVMKVINLKYSPEYFLNQIFQS